MGPLRAMTVLLETGGPFCYSGEPPDEQQVGACWVCHLCPSSLDTGSSGLGWGGGWPRLGQLPFAPMGKPGPPQRPRASTSPGGRHAHARACRAWASALLFPLLRELRVVGADRWRFLGWGFGKSPWDLCPGTASGWGWRLGPQNLRCEWDFHPEGLVVAGLGEGTGNLQGASLRWMRGKEGWTKEGLLRGGGAGSFTQPGLGMAAPSRTVTPPSIVTLFLAFLGPRPLLTTTDSHISSLLSLPLAWPHPWLWLPLEGPWLWAVGQLPWS